LTAPTRLITADDLHRAARFISSVSDADQWLADRCFTEAEEADRMHELLLAVTILVEHLKATYTPPAPWSWPYDIAHKLCEAHGLTDEGVTP
jgi:hypothetical protein